MVTAEREDALDLKLSGQSKAARLIGDAAALMDRQAYELKLSHTVNGEWPVAEGHVKAEHDRLLEMVRGLWELKASCQGILDSSACEVPEGLDATQGEWARINGRNHIPDATKMVQGDVQLMGEVTDEEGNTYSPAMVVEFPSVEDFLAAKKAGQCRFTVFGGEA